MKKSCCFTYQIRNSHLKTCIQSQLKLLKIPIKSLLNSNCLDSPNIYHFYGRKIFDLPCGLSVLKISLGSKGLMLVKVFFYIPGSVNFQFLSRVFKYLKFTSHFRPSSYQLFQSLGISFMCQNMLRDRFTSNKSLFLRKMPSLVQLPVFTSEMRIWVTLEEG